MRCELFVGNKNYSSWSLRAWLVLRFAGIPFQEHLVQLAQPGYGKGEIAELRALAPTGQVPVLLVNTSDQPTLTIWDTLAIAEWAAEQAAMSAGGNDRSIAPLWPRSSHKRAVARSLTAEMHSGFAGVRRDLSMNIKRRTRFNDYQRELPADTVRGLQRIESIFAQAEGPYLLGERGIVDAFYTPVATRLRSYGIALSQSAQRYVDQLLSEPDFLDWESACEPDSWDQHGYSVIDGLFRNPV